MNSAVNTKFNIFLLIISLLPQTHQSAVLRIWTSPIDQLMLVEE